MTPDQPVDSAESEETERVSFDFGALPAVRPGAPYWAEFRIAIKHLMSKKADAMISIVAVLSVLGVLGSVALVNVVLAVMTGFQVEFRDRILGANAHVVVQGLGGQLRNADQIVELADGLPGVRGAAPFIYSETILKSSTRYSGVVLKGFDPERTDRVTDLARDLIVGPRGALSAEERMALFRGMSEPNLDPTLPDLLAMRLLTDTSGADGLIFRVDDGTLHETTPPTADPAPGDEPELEYGLDRHTEREPEREPEPLPGILIGKDLALHLEIGPGSEVQLVDPFGGGQGPMGMPNPRVRRARVAGIYQSGFPEYDAKWVYMANPDVQDYLRMGTAVTGVELSLHDMYAAPVVASALQAGLGPLNYTRTWQEMNKELFQALALERQVSALVLFSTVLIAALLIVCVLIMMVLTKTREISILRAMGASRTGILRIFIIEGTLIGIVGSALGTGLGLVVCLFLEMYGWPLNGAVYLLSTLPVQIDLFNVIGIAVGAVLCCFLATLYPAFSAARIDPVEGLRYE